MTAIPPGYRTRPQTVLDAYPRDAYLEHMASFRITVAGTARTFSCRDAQSVLSAMVANGADAIPVGCRSGGCGVCRVEVESGTFETGCMSHAQVGDADRARGIALACQVFPTSDLRIRVLGRPSDDAQDAAAALFRRFAQRAAAGAEAAATRR